MTFDNNMTLSYDDICLVPAYSDLESRSEAKINFKSYNNPIISAPMIHTSSADMLRFMTSNNMTPTVHRYFKNGNEQLKHVIDAVGSDYQSVFFAVGRCTDWIKTLHDAGVVRFVVDMAHGDSKPCVDTIKYIKSLDKDSLVMAGNVATAIGYKRLIDAGADFVRVGIAGGSICSTAKNTAFGVPMITSIMECAEVKDAIGGYIIADGGIRSASDMLKAIAAGADMVMCGKILASTSEAEGPFYDNDNFEISEMIHEGYLEKRTDVVDFWAKYVEYAGMASHEMRMRNGSHNADEDTSIEGVAGKIKYTGTTDRVVKAIEANLRAGLSYCGARNFTEFKSKVLMRRMSVSGIIEKETHLDIKV